MDQPVYITENNVKSLMTWNIVFEAVEQSFMSVCEPKVSNDQPISTLTPRTFTFSPDKSGVLLTMPGYIGNFKLPSIDKNTVQNTLGCKLVTSFRGNENLKNINLPNILGTIFLFDTNTGKLNCILEATEITAWRTAAASLVATQHLFLNRVRSVDNCSETYNISIIGTGVQGRIHAIAMCSYFDRIKKISLWNRTDSKATKLANELNSIKMEKFLNKNIEIAVFDTVEKCVKDADIIVTTTSAEETIVEYNWIKPNCHINAIGSGANHYSELSQEIYNNCNVYIDSYANARSELKDLKTKIIGEVGEVIIRTKNLPNINNLTVFQSLGMALEDAAVAQAIFLLYKQNTDTNNTSLNDTP